MSLKQTELQIFFVKTCHQTMGSIVFMVARKSGAAVAKTKKATAESFLRRNALCFLL
jgi:hypothetical protein